MDGNNKKKFDRKSISGFVIARDWHPSKNGDLSPSDVTPGSNRKVWWVCEKGHEWEAVVFSRTGRGSGCPYCTGRTVGVDNNLAVLYPDIAKQWHPTKNGVLAPTHVLRGSRKKVWWVCEKGHEWKAAICDRTSGRGCPFCAGKKAAPDNSIASKFPELAQEWHGTKNRDLTPDDVTPGSQKRIWWVCKTCGQEWLSAVSSRTRGTGCPACSGRIVGAKNNLAVLKPELAKQWHPLKNEDLSPANIAPRSHRKVWWRCPKCGNEWQAAICDRTSGRGCPFCAGKKASSDNSIASKFPELAQEWHGTKNGDLTPDDVTPGSHKRMWWHCNKCGHEWLSAVSSRTRGTGCPACSRKKAD